MNAAPSAFGFSSAYRNLSSGADVIVGFKVMVPMSAIIFDFRLFIVINSWWRDGGLFRNVAADWWTLLAVAFLSTAKEAVHCTCSAAFYPLNYCVHRSFETWTLLRRSRATFSFVYSLGSAGFHPTYWGGLGGAMNWHSISLRAIFLLILGKIEPIIKLLEKWTLLKTSSTIFWLVFKNWIKASLIQLDSI